MGYPREVYAAAADIMDARRERAVSRAAGAQHFLQALHVGAESLERVFRRGHERDARRLGLHRAGVDPHARPLRRRRQATVRQLCFAKREQKMPPLPEMTLNPWWKHM